MEEPAPPGNETVSTVGELDFAVVTLREFLHRSNAYRAVAIVERETGIGPAEIDCERFRAIEVNLGDRVVLLDHNVDLAVQPPPLPTIKPLPAFQVNAVLGEVTGTIGGLKHLVDGVSALAAALGGRNVAMALFESDDPDSPLTITARADGSEAPVITIADESFTLPAAPAA